MRSVFLLIFATGIAVACAKPPSPVAETWGNSTHAIRAAQTQNPEADHGPVERLEGLAPKDE